MSATSTAPVTATRKTRTMLIKFPHGLGDAVQFTVVLKHLAKAYADWAVDVVSKRGKHTAFRGLCRQIGRAHV